MCPMELKGMLRRVQTLLPSWLQHLLQVFWGPQLLDLPCLIIADSSSNERGRRAAVIATWAAHHLGDRMLRRRQPQ